MSANREYFHGLDIKGVAFSEVTQELLAAMRAQIASTTNLVETEITKIRNEIARTTPIPFPTETSGLDWQALYWYSSMVSAAHEHHQEIKVRNEKIIAELEQAKTVLTRLASQSNSPLSMLENTQHDIKILSKHPNLFADLTFLLDEIFDSTNRDIVVAIATDEMHTLSSERNVINDKIYAALQILVNSADYENINPIHLKTVLVKLKHLADDLRNPELDYQKTSQQFSAYVASQKRSMIGQQLLFALKAIAAALLTIATLGIKRNTASELFNTGHAHAKLHRDIYYNLTTTHTEIKKRGRQ